MVELLLRSAKAHLVPTAPPVEMECGNCGNTSAMRLYTMKHGPGIGIPILMFFDDRFILSARKKGYVCPVCDAFTEV